VPDVVHQLVATERALDKLAAGVSRRTSRRRCDTTGTSSSTIRAIRSAGGFLIGSTDGGRVLTLVIEQTVDPTTWLIVTGRSATEAERRILSRRR
jgi:hypothetical protein